jgi:hypothetical protein
VKELKMPIQRSHLSINEKEVVLKLWISIRSVAPASDIATPPLNMLAKAWGVTPKMIRNIAASASNSSTLEIVRKVCSNKGTSIFNSEQKRNGVYMPLEIFKRYRRRDARGEALSNNELLLEWENAKDNLILSSSLR